MNQQKIFDVIRNKITLLSTDDYEKGRKSINRINGYKDVIKYNGVYAIHVKYLK